jgi:thymidylate synthase ThyX
MIQSQISVKVLAHSINPAGGDIISMLLTMPRYALAEFNTHRLFSRNAASSRAMPVKKLRAMCSENPVFPFIWGANQKGMQSFEMVAAENRDLCEVAWREGAKAAAELSERLESLGLHKQWANRPMEAFLPTTVLLTTTELGNFFNLRAHVAALPDFGQVAYTVLWHYHRSKPVPLEWGAWHMPFMDKVMNWQNANEEYIAHLNGGGRLIDPIYDVAQLSHLTTHQLGMRLKIATARAARLSYLTFDGFLNLSEDFNLHDSLADNGHWSPFEHSAMAEPEVPEEFLQLKTELQSSQSIRLEHLYVDYVSKLDGLVKRDHGNFHGGWRQFRKFFPNENLREFDYDAIMRAKPDWIILPEEPMAQLTDVQT